jgi:hypothetical protein
VALAHGVSAESERNLLVAMCQSGGKNFELTGRDH